MTEASLIKTAAAARILGVSSLRVRQLADSGELEATRTECGTRLFRRADVERLAAHREISPPRPGRRA